MQDIFFPMFFHMIWCVLLYAVLTIVRAPSVWSIGKASPVAKTFKELEPKVSANLANQFEWPVFFYAICLLQIAAAKEPEPSLIFLAWVFVIGRFLHSAVQILTTNIRLRGIVFTINFLAVIGMWLLTFDT